MANPYEAPGNPTQATGAVPSWYVVFSKACSPAWWIGTALITCSWFHVVSPTVGWIGFGLSLAATLGAMWLPALAGVKPEDHVLLDSRLLKSKDEAYRNMLQRFSEGATLVFDGVAFAFRPENHIACAVVAYSPQVTEVEARELADHAQSVFDTLDSSSPEFAAAIAGRRFRISVMSGPDQNTRELFRVVDGNLQSCD